MTRERGGAAGLRVADCALRVACRRRGEDDPADDEDERRQPEGDACDEAERVIDRGADVAVGGGEQGIRPENAVELVRLATPAGHALRLVGLSEELVRNRGEDDVWLEEEQPLDVEGPLVVQKAAPAAGDEL